MDVEKERFPLSPLSRATLPGEGAARCLLPVTTGVIAQASHASGELRRTLGLREAVAVGVGGTIGGGIFVLVGTAAAEAGPGAVLSFVLAFVASLLIALPYAELACRYPLAGGGYAVVRAVLGRPWGFLMGWGYWGAWLFMSGYTTLGFGGYLEALTGITAPVGAVALVALVTAANLGGIRFAGRVQMLLVALAIAGLAGFAAAGLPSLRMNHFSPFLPYGAGGAVAGALPAFLAFGGFDMVATAGEEIADPEEVLPRAILLTLGIVAVLYLLVTIVAIGVLPWAELSAATAPLTAVAGRFAGTLGVRGITVAALVTMAATADAVLLAASRVAFAMARDGFFPAPMARVDPRVGVPATAILVSGALIAVNAAVGSVALAAAAGGFLYVLHFVLPLVALAVLRRRGGPRPRFQTPAVTFILPAALLLCGVLLLASGWTGVLIGGGWLVAGFVAHQAACGWRAN
jgi:APA family basic amino acid/polyamine antiporter